MTAIDPKALEAAAQAIAKTGMTAKGIAEFNWEKDFAYSERHEFMVQAEAAIQAYLSHPDSGWVPRSELVERTCLYDEWRTKFMEERQAGYDEARRKLQEMIAERDHLLDELTEARKQILDLEAAAEDTQ